MSITKSRSLMALAGVALLAGGLIVQADDPVKGLVFRVAQDEPSSGLTEYALPDSDDTIFVSGINSLDGGDVKQVSFGRDEAGHRVVGLSFTEAGARKMAKVTSENAPAAAATSKPRDTPDAPSPSLKRLAILLDGKVIMAPKIQATISSEAQLSGRFSDDELTRLFTAIVLHRDGSK